jgi:D-alanyl-D-alanine carboxypeptidase
MHSARRDGSDGQRRNRTSPDVDLAPGPGQVVMSRAVQRLLCLWMAAMSLAVVAAPARAARPDRSEPQRHPAPRPELQQRLEHLVATGAPGVVALVNDGSRSGHRHHHRIWTAASGVADLQSGRPMRPEDGFRAGSQTKPFVATVVLQLVDEGRLKLSDTVERWLPGILPYGDQITVRELLSHTSGVPDSAVIPKRDLYHGIRFRSWTPRQLVALIAGQPPLFPAGSAWSYSNTNYVLAGLIVEAVTGDSLGRELERRIIRPLRLRHTYFPVNFPFLVGPHASGYSVPLDDQFNPIEGPLLDLTVFNPSGVWAAGNLVSSERDLARFFRALLGGRLLSGSLLDDMKQPVAVMGPLGYGLGLITVDTPCGRVFGHEGGIPGFANWLLTSDDGSRQFGVMMNAEDAPAAASELFTTLALDQGIREAFSGQPCAAGDPVAPQRLLHVAGI